MALRGIVDLKIKISLYTMPTVNILKHNFEQEMGKKYSFEELEQLCFDFGIELEEYTETDEESK